jgi:glutathione synthase/RimK-type ligase-like ATP-grasp enzyme
VPVWLAMEVPVWLVMEVALVTGRSMPAPDLEMPLLVAALDGRGVRGVVVPWGEPFDWSSVPLVLVRSPWDYFRHLEAFLGWAEQVERVTTLVNPASVLSWNSHKRYLTALADHGVPTVPTSVVGRGASTEVRRSELAAHRGEVVIKPAVSVGAIGAFRGPAGSVEAGEHLAGLVAKGDALVQPFQAVVLDEGELSLVYLGGAFSHAVRKVPVPGDYRVQVHYGGRVRPHQPTGRQRHVAEAALAIVPAPVSYARVDMVGEHDPVIMELELIEPELFLRHRPGAPRRFAEHLVGLLPAL